jgi:hypothetical protein
MAKASPFEGRWRIIETELSDKDGYLSTIPKSRGAR